MVDLLIIGKGVKDSVEFFHEMLFILYDLAKGVEP